MTPYTEQYAGNANPRILKLPAVKYQSGLGRSSIYAGVKAGTFPAPVNLGPRAVGWLSHEVDAWVAGRIAASRKPTGGV